MIYDIYHDECKEDGYWHGFWHGFLFVPRQTRAELLGLLNSAKRILEGIGARFSGSVDKHYEEIERELVRKVARPSGLTGGELDRILFQNYGDIMVRLLCP